MMSLFFPDMRQRNTTDRELMDLPDADLERLLRTVRQFRWINMLVSASRGLIREHFFRVMEKKPDRVYTLLDVGAGGCDIAVWAADEAVRRGLKLEITALDNDPRILPVARQAVRNHPGIRLLEGSALELHHLGDFDFVFSNHFLHHLGWDDIRIFLEQVIQRTRLAFVMNDLKRSRWAYLGGTILIGLLARRSFAFYDGRLSIRRGFLPEELRSFVADSFPGIPVRVYETLPARVVMVHSVDHSAKFWIDSLDLTRHPEGGWFRETYRSSGSIPGEALPERFAGPRRFCTAIYFLLERGDFSALHRIKSDEIWHFHEGAPLTVHVITPEGEYYWIRLGRDADNGECFQAVVPAGCWFGAETCGEFSLVGCTVSPGFDFRDFEMAVRAVLTHLFPRHSALVSRLTRN